MSRWATGWPAKVHDRVPVSVSDSPMAVHDTCEGETAAIAASGTSSTRAAVLSSPSAPREMHNAATRRSSTPSVAKRWTR